MQRDLLVTPGGLLLFAPATDKFIRSLAVAPPVVAEPLRARLGAGTPIVTVRRATDTSHTRLLSALWRHLAPDYPLWDLIDVGGFIGSTILPVAVWIRDNGLKGRVRAVVMEPSAMADLLADSIRLNGCQDVVQLVRLAASARPGSVSFTSNPESPVAGRVTFGAAGAHTMTVAATTLDQIVRKTANFLFLKIDAEGHEPHILTGSEQTLARIPTVMVVEFHHSALTAKVGDTPYTDFLFNRFRLWDIGNYAYLSRCQPIAAGDVNMLEQVINRDGNRLTDILCVDLRIPETTALQIVAEATAKRA